MNVLVITDNLRPDSGWGRYSAAVTRELELQNIMVSTAAIPKEGNERYSCTLRPLRSIKDFIINILNVRRAARGQAVVHAFDGWPYSIYGYFAVLGTNRKFFINGVGTYAAVPFEDKFKGFLMRLAYRRAERIFCISRYTEKRILEKIHPVRTEIVYLGLSRLPELSEAERAGYKKKFSFFSRSPLLLTVGEVKDRKGQMDVLQAVGIIKEKYPRVLYIVAGHKDSGYVAEMERYARDHNLTDNLMLVGNVFNDKELAFLYESCNVFILASNSSKRYFEGFGLVLLEAAQYGKPVIGSRDSGTEEALENGYNGYIVRQRDSADIAEKVIKILDSNQTILAQNAREFASRFIWQKTVQSYIEAYTKS